MGTSTEVKVWRLRRGERPRPDAVRRRAGCGAAGMPLYSER